MLVYDDDHFYLGGLMAELLRAEGRAVTLLTPAPDVSHFTHATMEQHRIQSGLMRSGVRIVTLHSLAAIGDGEVTACCEYTGEELRIEAASVVMLSARLPEEALYRALLGADLDAAGIRSLRRVGSNREWVTFQ